MNTIKVVSSSLLKQDIKDKIEATFRRKHTQKTVFEYEVDESLLGGILVIDGENYYDASVRGQLATIKRDLR